MRLYKFDAMILWVGLLSLSGILSLIFLAREKFISYEHHANHYYQQYLTDKMTLLKYSELDEESECQQAKDNQINIALKHLRYQFHCEKLGFFIDALPSKKAVIFKRISDHLSLDETIPLIRLNSLADLPLSSVTEPKIVILEQDIDEKLSRDFYGILITSHKFKLKNGAKIYGVLYSSDESNKNNRYITYHREVVKYFDQHYSKWRFLPYSRNLLNAK